MGACLDLDMDLWIRPDPCLPMETKKGGSVEGGEGAFRRGVASIELLHSQPYNKINLLDFVKCDY